MHVTFLFAVSSKHAKTRTSKFRKVVRQHTEAMVEVLNEFFLEIYVSFPQLNNFENTLRIDKLWQ